MTDPSTPYRVCVVCAGNICRSPIAEFVLRHRLEGAGLGDLVTVDSAGTGGWHAGQQADPRALAALHDHGYDGSDHRARQFRREWFADVDLVLALDRDNFADLSTLAPDDDARAKVQLLRSYDPDAEAGDDTEVPDPYYGDAAAFERVLLMIERASDGFVTAVSEEIELDVPGGEPSRQ
ncbi:low molecular weight protein-tyrosine-phosphatase [Jiangella endophytica]|uniref:low molecular weight protein-tyrosine-phosphatase n=1 Tax=Jiangella endophytica TaxID=1623398 RepID=UPI000E347F37|nr:low molecular weight protein-tyrosine-phosphatase [Jiangella endophytica]